MQAPPRQILLQQLSTTAAACLPARRCRRARGRPALPLAAATAQGLTYEAAGVNIDAGSELVRRIQKMNPSIGGFSGMVPFGASTVAKRGSEIVRQQGVRNFGHDASIRSASPEVSFLASR
jgi:hypothetical protein